MPVISTVELKTPALLRRAHLVLAFMQHFYIQSLPPEVEPIVIPRSVGLPFLHVSQTLDIPPILTLSDTVLYNWYIDPTKDKDGLPHPENVRTRTMFTNTLDEEEFYLCSSRIELRGVEALEWMKMTMDEMFIGDHISMRRISAYLRGMVTVINDCRTLLLEVKKHCRPDVYYNNVRPWFRGQDSDNRNRQWIFEGIEDDPTLRPPTEISGPSAGQSSMVHAFDIFLGIDHSSATQTQPSFMSRMQVYMPRNHRLFLDHLKANSRPLRSFVLASKDEELTMVYNEAVMALKGFRDSHMVITALYVIGPARRAAKVQEGKTSLNVHDNPSVVGTFTDGPLRGTGGSELVQFLKDTRTRTVEAVVLDN
jgi:indoleamine 2,3-dioxygenase